MSEPKYKIVTTATRPKVSPVRSSQRQHLLSPPKSWILISFLVVTTAGAGFMSAIVATAQMEKESGIGPSCDGCSTAPAPGLQLALSPDFNAGNYFAVVYLPKILAVVVQSCWFVVYSAAQMVDPFYRLLSRRGYTPGKSALVSNLQALGTSRRSWIFALVWAVHVFLGVLVSLIPEAFKVEAADTCVTDLSDDQPCDPQLDIDQLLCLILAVVLGLTAAMTLAITVLNRTRENSPVGNSTSILALADMLQDEDVVRELRSIPPDAGEKDVKRVLKNSVWRLGHFTTALNEHRYGIFGEKRRSEGMPKLGPPGYELVVNLNHGQTHPGSSTRGNAQHRVQSQGSSSTTSLSRKLNMHVLKYLAIFALISVLFILILTYYLLPWTSQSPINTFMNSGSFGPRFLVSTFALLISLGFKQAEIQVRVVELYDRMARSPQPAHLSIEVGMTSSPWTTLIDGLRRRQWFTAAVAFAALISEVLMIVVSGVPFGPVQTAGAYKACSIVSLIVLGFMAIVVGMLIWKSWKREAGSPVANVLPISLENRAWYLCGSNLLQRPRSANHEQTAYGGYVDDDSHGRFCVFERATGPDDVVRWTVNGVRHGVP